MKGGGDIPVREGGAGRAIIRVFGNLTAVPEQNPVYAPGDSNQPGFTSVR